MSKTISRKYCNQCNKRNLCSWEYKGSIVTKCKTMDCDNKEDLMQNNNFVMADELDFIDFKEPYRGLSSKTCNFLGIKIAANSAQEIISYDHNNLDSSLSIKRRYPNKVFDWKNKTSSTTMFALDKCTDFTKPLIITEGNEDAASFWEIDHQACSILSAGNETNDIELAIDYINKFPSIILAIDKDKAGDKVFNNVRKLLSHKKLYQIDFNDFKDANEVLQQPNGNNLLEDLLKGAKEILPKGIVFGSDLKQDDLWINPPKAIPFPWKGLNNSMVGLEYGQLYAFFGGSSIGKSSVLRELVYYFRINNPELKIANIFLEENQKVTPLVYLSLHTNTPLGKLKRDKSLIPEEQREELFNTVLNTKNLTFINEEYERDSANLLKTIEYLSKVENYDIIVLDHISYIIGRSKVGKNGERRDIDELLYNLQDLARNLNIIIIFACHLSDPNQPPSWDEGRVPSMYNGRGSRVLAQVPDGIIAVSRNMSDPYQKDILKLHCLKNRWDGIIGQTDELIYISETGRLISK